MRKFTYHVVVYFTGADGTGYPDDLPETHPTPEAAFEHGCRIIREEEAASYFEVVVKEVPQPASGQSDYVPEGC